MPGGCGPGSNGRAMNSTDLAIRIIPDLTIDEKYTAIIEEALKRITSFTDNAVERGRVEELFQLEKSKITGEQAIKLLKVNGRLMVGFQFESKPDEMENNFRVFVKKVMPKNKSMKFYLTPTVQEIMLQLISLEDRRTIAIFSMLNSSMDVGYRILSTLYGNQLKRLLERAAPIIRDGIAARLEKLKVQRDSEDSGLWETGPDKEEPKPTNGGEHRGKSEDNILQVMTDDTVFDEINEYVQTVKSRNQRIQEKRRRLEENPDMPRSEIYEKMIKEDLDQLENCYARMHIYLKAYYKNKDKRNNTRNSILRQFFAGQIEEITGETSLLEDLLALSEENYFKNLDRHRELEN